MIYSQIMSLNPRERAGSHPSGHPPPSLRLPFFLASPCLIFDRISKIHIFGTKLQSCLETYFIRSRSSSAMKIYVRDSTVIRNNEIHKMYDEILNELGDLATVVSRSYVYGKIKDAIGLSVRHISRIINHTKAVDVR